MRISTEVGNEYFEYWAEVLHQLLGWDRRHVMIWALQFESQINDENSLLFHEEPGFYLATLLVPDSIKERTTRIETIRLAGRLVQSIYLGRADEGSARDYDWEAAKHRLNAILAEYGENLDNVRRQYE
jgi:hypothetical protein